jgi:peptidoglycan L-alanyl-D-glutamate endopeptidase CwlK
MPPLSPTSVLRLKQVHPDLASVIAKASMTCTQQFAVFEGVRSQADQLAAFQRHTSKLNGYPIGSRCPDGSPGTGMGKHQINPIDGYGHAVDLVPLVDLKFRWEWPLIYPIAAAMRDASIALGITLRWGGVWDRHLNDLPDPLTTQVSNYCTRHDGPDFLDGPHYELVNTNPITK